MSPGPILLNRARPLPPLPELELPRIVGVDITPITRPLRRPFRTALREVTTLHGLQVTIHAVDGRFGEGTTTPTPVITGDTYESITATVTGPLTDALGNARHTFASALAAVQASAPDVPSARAATDVAVHALAAQCLGVPLAGLFGPPAGEICSDMTVSLDTPTTMAEAARAAVADGHRTVKCKLGDPDVNVDLSRTRAVRAAVGDDITLRVDANQAWTQAAATTFVTSTADLGLELVEQPVAAADLHGLAAVRAASTVPIVADESAFTAADVRAIAAAQAADAVVLKLAKCGGLGPARAFIDAAADTGLGLIVGCMLEPAEGVEVAWALAAAAAIGPAAHDLDAAYWV